MVATGIMVVTEGPRGCGYRKQGGKYLISAGVSVACPALPLEVSRCPCCDRRTVPPLSFCGRCWKPIEEMVCVGPRGMLESFAVVLHCLAKFALCLKAIAEIVIC